MAITSYLGSLAFLLVTLAMGGGAAWMTGRAIAGAWRPAFLVVPSIVLLSFAVRFLHYALAHEPLFAPEFSAIDLVVLLALGLLGWQRTRARQMVEQYPWLYEAAGPLWWRHKR